MNRARAALVAVSVATAGPVLAMGFAGAQSTTTSTTSSTELDLCPDGVCFSPPLGTYGDPVITLAPPKGEGLPTWPLPTPPRRDGGEAPVGPIVTFAGPAPFTG